MPKIIRITTVASSLKYLIPGQLKYMKVKGNNVIAVSANGPEREEIMCKEDCNHIIVPMTRKITPFQDLFCLLKLVLLFIKEKPDIVHTHTPKAGLLGMIAGKICLVKLRIHTVAGMPLMTTEGMKYKLLKAIEKLTYRCAHHVWPNSFSLLKFIQETKLTSNEKLHVINKGSSNGIDLQRFSRNTLDLSELEAVKKEIDYKQQNFYIVTIGRLVKDKGIEEVVSTFLRIEKKHSNLKLILIGSFEDELDPLSQEIKNEIKANANIIHVEWSSQIEYYLFLANIFLFASHREGFPNVLLQAGAMETPIVCSNIVGNIDIVENDKTGLIFTSADEDEMQMQIERSIENPIKNKQYSLTLRSIIEQNYSQPKIWEAIHKKYQELLHK